jgi:hypothetical protein
MTSPRPRLVRREQAPGAGGAREHLVAEYVRHFLSCNAFDGESFDPHPVHAGALRQAVLRQLGELAGPPSGAAWPSDDLDRPREHLDLSDPFRLALHKLVVLGEAAELGNGFYLPSPLRLVELHGGITLALSGLPTWALTRRLRLGGPESAGLARLVSGKPPSDLPRQSAAEWLSPFDETTPNGWSIDRDADEVRLTLTRSLPRGAMRLLYALGREQRPGPTAFPLAFQTSGPLWQAIEARLVSYVTAELRQT